jgi:hypothetical protein
MTRELVPDEVDGWQCTGSIDEREPNAVAVSLDLLKIGTSAKGHSRGRFIPPFQLEPIQMKLAIRSETQLRETRNIGQLYASQASATRKAVAVFDQVDGASVEGVVVNFLGLTFLLCVAG